MLLTVGDVSKLYLYGSSGDGAPAKPKATSEDVHYIPKVRPGRGYVGR